MENNINDVVYFELNNWFAGRDYPNAEPFLTWMHTDIFSNDEWLKENKLVCVKSYIDMSMNFCITASLNWVEKNCPKLISGGVETYTIISRAKRNLRQRSRRTSTPLTLR